MRAKKTFVVDRSKWRCGDNGENKVGRGKTALLNRSGFMCCLGFAAHQCGIKKKDILGVPVPHKLKDESIGAVDGVLVDRNHSTFRFVKDTDLSNKAMTLNDTGASRAKREAGLRKLFRQHGYVMKFVGRYAKRAK